MLCMLATLTAFGLTLGALGTALFAGFVAVGGALEVGLFLGEQEERPNLEQHRQRQTVLHLFKDFRGIAPAI